MSAWQKKDLLDQLDEEYAKLIPTKPQAAAAKPNVNLGRPFKPTYAPAEGQTPPHSSGVRLFAGLPGQKKANEPQKKAVVRNPFTYLNLGQQTNPGKRLADPVLPGGQTYAPPSILKKLTAEDYVRAWENRDWNTTEAYANGIRNGSISDTGMTPSQRQRFQDATLNQLTQPQMNLVLGVLGVGNGVSMDLLESSLRMNANRQDETGRLAQASLHVIDRLKDEAPVGYQIGYGVGQMIPIYGAGSVAGETVGNVVKQPYLREAAIGALSTAAPTVVSGVAQGKPAGQIALETVNNAALGTLYGMGLRYLGEVLPQPGTIPYYQMEGRGGLQKKLAPIVGGIAQGLNPNGVVAVDDLGIVDNEIYGYNYQNTGNSGTANKRVGRWMSQAEYDNMISTVRVQESFSGTTHVAYPNNLDSYIKQAKPGSIYVEFDLPQSNLKQTDMNNGWAKIIGPNSLEGRLAAKKGNAILNMPRVDNIVIAGRK